MQRFSKLSLPMTFAAVLGFVGSCKPAPPDNHGYVRLQLRRSQSEADSPFVGTAKIVAQIYYNQCLADFYDMLHPEYKYEGTKGAEVFADWQESLCDHGEVDCTVESFAQFFSARSGLQTHYQIQEASVEYKDLAVGPFPNDRLVKSCQPVIDIAYDSLRGLDGAGNTIWVVDSTQHPSAIPGQHANVEIYCRRQG